MHLIRHLKCVLMNSTPFIKLTNITVGRIALKRSVGFGGSQLGLKDASIGGGGGVKHWGQVCGRAGREGVQIARLEEGGGVPAEGGGVSPQNSFGESHT